MYEIRAKHKVKGTYGIDVPEGTVMITAIMDFHGLPEYEDPQAWVDGLDQADAHKIINDLWIGFQFLDTPEHHGNQILPAYAFDEIVNAAK